MKYLFEYKLIGITVEQYLIFLAFLVSSFILSRLVYLLFKFILRRFAKRTKFVLDDIILDKIKAPVSFLVVIVGMYAGFQYLNLSTQFLRTLDNLLHVSIAVAFAWFLLGFIDKTANYYEKKSSNQPIKRHIIPLTNLILKSFLIIFTMIYIVRAIGYNVTSLLASLGIGGLAVALAAQELLKNIIGGVVIMVDQPFKIGEWVQIQEYKGTVEEIGLRSVRIKTSDTDYISIPNHIITETSVANLTKFPITRIIFNLRLSLQTTLEQIEKIKPQILEALHQTESIIPKSGEVTFTTFGDFSLDLYIAFAFEGNTPSQERKIKDKVNIKIKAILEKEQIKLATFPNLNHSV